MTKAELMDETEVRTALATIESRELRSRRIRKQFHFRTSSARSPSLTASPTWRSPQGIIPTSRSTTTA